MLISVVYIGKFSPLGGKNISRCILGEKYEKGKSKKWKM
jgi:hypothetical protein